MNDSISHPAVDILELLVRNPYNLNVPVEEFYRVINHFYRVERSEFDAAVNALDEAGLVRFAYDSNGGIETMIRVTEKGEEQALVIFPEIFYGMKPDPRALFCP
jgi:DNA-binding MarR family transcriptional regulator